MRDAKFFFHIFYMRHMVQTNALFFYRTLSHTLKNHTNKTQSGHLPYWQERSRGMLPCWAQRSQPCCSLTTQSASRGILQQQTSLQCVTDSWLPSKEVTLHLQWCYETRKLHYESYPLSHTTHRDTGQADTRCLWQHRLFLAQSKPRRPHHLL